MIFKFIKAEQFFPAYCPWIKSYKKKISGRDSRGKPIDFSEKEKKEILTGLKIMIEEYKTNP